MKKNNCIDCEKETTNGVYILTGKDWTYEFYCINCSRAYLERIKDKTAPNFLKLSRTDLNTASKEYDMILFKNTKSLLNHGYAFKNVPLVFKRNIISRTKL